MNISLNDIARLISGHVIGDGQIMISALSPIDDIAPNALIFAEGDDNILRAQNSPAAAVMVSQPHPELTKPIIQVSNPFHAFIHLLGHFYPPKAPEIGVHPTAIVAPDAILGKNVSIGPYVIINSQCQIGDHAVIKGHVHIGHNVTIGAHTVMHPHVTIYDNSHIGNHVTIHASTVIGSDGFGYTLADGQHMKVPHVGHVIIADHVEIGANSVIDRATIGATMIGEGTKIDNLVQIAHSVKIGKHNILCAFTGIAGSSTSGDHVIFAANVGVSDHVKIDDGVILGARAGVPPKKHLRQGNIYLGNPARPRDKAIEQELATTRIPIMRKNIKQLNDKMNQLLARLEPSREE